MAILIKDALNSIYENTKRVNIETIPIEESLNRVLAQDCIASFSLPRFDNSAMDGFAVSFKDSNKRVDIVDTIFAGDNPTKELKSGNCMKIMTGALIPKGADAIVPIEDVKEENNQILLPNVKEGNFIRYSGEDIAKEKVYLKRGEEINPYSIALLTSQGVTHIKVYRKVKVAILSTGDELRPYFEKIEPHQLYNSNSPMFFSRAKSLGCEVSTFKNSRDSIEELKNSIELLKYADVIITSGGVSKGDKDYTKEAFLELGMDTLFDGVEIKPGKPTLCGILNRSIVVALPGNPLASMVNFELFVRPIIWKMSGTNNYYHNFIETTIEEDYHIKKGKYTVKLGYFDGTFFKPLKKQLPGMISPLNSANSFIIVPPKKETIKKEEKIKVILLENFKTDKNRDLFS